MPDTILVVIEQRENKLNRVSWETITAGQAIAAATGWTLEAAVVGAKVAELAREVAAKTGLEIRVLDEQQLLAERMNSLLAVAASVGQHGEQQYEDVDPAHAPAPRPADGTARLEFDLPMPGIAAAPDALFR